MKRAFLKLACWLLCGLLAGCHAWEVRGGDSGSQAGVRTTVYSYDPVIAGLVVAIVLIDGLQYYIHRDGSRTPVRAAEPDPGRPVNVQDCTAPIDPERGNLLCR